MSTAQQDVPLDALHGRSDPDSWWSSANLAEAMPGVLTPMGWSIWGDSSELSTRLAFFATGALRKSELPLPARPEERFIAAFFGRVAGRVDFLCLIGDRMPGTSGTEVADQLLGFVPPGIVANPTYRQLPSIATRLPRTFLRTPKRVRSIRAATEPWWQQRVATRQGHRPGGSEDPVG